MVFGLFFLSGVINKLKFIDLQNTFGREMETNIVVNSKMCLKSITVTLDAGKSQSS